MFILTKYDGNYTILDTRDFATDVLTEEQLYSIVKKNGYNVVGLYEKNGRFVIDNTRLYAKNKKTNTVSMVYNQLSRHIVLYPLSKSQDGEDCITIEIYDLVDDEKPYKIKQVPIGVSVQGIYEAGNIIRVVLNRPDGSKKVIAISNKSTVTYQ